MLTSFSHKSIYLISLFLFLYSVTSIAQEYSFQSFDISKGLSHNSVRCIIQDHDGFMWIGTYDGLNKFDGYDFTTYRNFLNDSTTIPHNFIYSIHEDNSGTIWVGTGQGLCIFDRKEQNFRPIYYNNSNGVKNKINVPINSIASDTKGNIYIATNGLGLLTCKKNSFEAKSLSTSSTLTISGSIAQVKVQPETEVIYFTNRNTITKYNPETKNLTDITNLPSGINGFEFDKDILWVAANSGLYKFSLSLSSTLKTFSTKNSAIIDNYIHSISLSKNQLLWIGTKGKGMQLLDIKNEAFKAIINNQSGQELHKETVYSICEDSKGQQWIGTREEGIHLITTRKQKFQTIRHIPYKTNSIPSNFVSAFCEDSEEKLWIGTEGSGISLWNRDKNTFTNYTGNPLNSPYLSYPIISNIKKDNNGNIWVATFGGGINKYNHNNHTFTHYKCYNDVANFENTNIWQLYEDKSGVLWATTFSRGNLYYFSESKDRFVVFDQTLIDLNCINEDQEKQMWAGNSHQLIKVNRGLKQHQFYEMDKPVRAIHPDKNGMLWIGSEGGGLILFDTASGTISKRFSTSDGLCNNSVLCILEDNSGYLWLSTFNGLSRFNKQSETFENFYQEDGLQSNQFLYGSALKLKSGEMVFGGVKGFNIFNPNHISSLENEKRPMFITQTVINSEVIAPSSKYVDEISANTKITKLRVPYNKASLSFKFAALDYFEPSSVRYAYYMEGLDEKWNYTDTYRYATYANLREGNYKLYLKTTQVDGSWTAKTLMTSIVVLPPWYRTWWAYSIYIMILIVIIKLYTNYQRKQERLKYRLELAELTVTKEKELHEKKLSFFTNISHEFRAPLSLIITPIKDFLNSKNSQVDTKELIIIYRNARRLLSLVDQLLYFRKSNVDQLNLSKFGLISFLKEVYACFVQQAKIKNITFNFETNLEELIIYADREKIEICLFNLLSNAFKYTPDNGKIVLKIQQENEHVIIKVIDTGSGIDPSVGNKIFENFYQVNEKGNTAKGFGIGLHLVKQLTEQHQGNVSYTSTSGKGTTFTLKIPLGCSQDEVISTNEETENHLQFITEMVETPEVTTVTDKVKKAEMEMVTEKKTILLVDDNNELRSYIKGIFIDNYIVQEADSAEAAFKKLEETLPDLIITDIVMNGMSGLELCEKIKQDNVLAHIPVILLTSSTSAEIKLKGIEGGADDFITKPFDKEILMARVINLLKSRNHIHQHFYNQITLKLDEYKISEDLKEFLDNCIKITEKHMLDRDFNVKTLAEELDMSHSALYRKVKFISGKSVNEFIRFIKLRKAAQLLINTENNISECAYAAGFNDLGYFRTQFKKVFGVTPSKYAKDYKKAGQKPFKINK